MFDLPWLKLVLALRIVARSSPSYTRIDVFEMSFLVYRQWVTHKLISYFHNLYMIAVCAISSRYYAEKSEIYPIAMHFAKHSAANALIDGWKSVELCQAYILMSIYAVPARRWEEDRSWLYTGLAIRYVCRSCLDTDSNSIVALRRILICTRWQRPSRRMRNKSERFWIGYVCGWSVSI